MLPTDKMEARRLTHRAKSFIVIKGELFKRSHTRILSRGRTCWKTSMKGSTDITPHLEPWSETHSSKVSTGQPWWWTPSKLYAPAKDASTMLDKLTCWPKRSR